MKNFYQQNPPGTLKVVWTLKKLFVSEKTQKSELFNFSLFDILFHHARILDRLKYVNSAPERSVYLLGLKKIDMMRNSVKLESVNEILNFLATYC